MIFSKTKLVYWSMALILILLAIFFYYFISKKQPIDQPISVEQLQQILETAPAAEPEANAELQLQEQAGAIIKTKDFNRCDEIKDEMYHTVCINNIALNLAQETQDISYCQKIDNKLVPIRDCESQVIFKKSLDKESIAICDETKDQELQKQCRNSFWPSLALKKQDNKLCDNIQTEPEKTFCYDNYVLQKEFTQDAANFKCTEFSDKQVRLDCTSYQANSKQLTMEMCNQFKSGLFLNFCFSQTLKGGIPR